MSKCCQHCAQEEATLTAERDALRASLAEARAWVSDTVENCSMASDPPKAGVTPKVISGSAMATITAERDAAITQAKHLSDWAAKMHDEMLHQSARANEWREEAIRLAAALRIWSGKYHLGVPELVEFEKMQSKERRP